MQPKRESDGTSMEFDAILMGSDGCSRWTPMVVDERGVCRHLRGGAVDMKVW